MAKRLSTGEWINRAIAQGRETVKSLAAKLGRAPSTISSIRSGKRPGENLRAAARDLAKGKRSPVAAPPVRHAKPRAAPVPPPKPPALTPLEKGERRLDKLDGNDRVVIHVTSKKTGQSFTLCRKGGVSPDTIRFAPSLADFLGAQGNAQGYGDFDFDDVVDIDFEEYY